MFVSSGASSDSRADRLCKQLGLQGRVMWFDAEANIWELSTRRGVANSVRMCKSVNINTIVVDVKPLSGLVLYRSSIAPRLARLRGRSYPHNYDLLRTVLEEGHKAGISVHAAVNVFSEGSQTQNGGPAHSNPDWQCVQYEMRRSISTLDAPDSVIECSEQPYAGRQIGIYGAGTERFSKLPSDSFYVRVTRDGGPTVWGMATGYARLSAPEDGYLLVGSGRVGNWLRDAVDRRAVFHLEGRKRLVKVSEGNNVHNAIFVNPLHPDARAYALSVIAEICDKYPIDGIVLDRMRYPNIYADFSDLTREAFEDYVGHPLENWPEDVFEIDVVPAKEVVRGPLFGEWLTFRAKVMRDFLSDAREVVKSRRPNALLGIYVGSWYPLYYDVGVNWGSRNHSADLEWWPDGYEETGYADLVDYMCTGCYYANPTRKDALAKGDEEWKSVEAAAEESINAVKDATFVYGSLYVYQYNGRPKKFAQAVRECLKRTQGCMIFDLVHIRNYSWWRILKHSFPSPAKAPAEVPGLLGRFGKGGRRK